MLNKGSCLLLGTLAMTGCSVTHVPTADPAFAMVRPVASEPLPLQDGAIYKTGYEMALFEDRRARRIGDVLTIVLTENTNASKTATTSTTKESEIDLPAPTIFGAPVTRNGVPILSGSVETSRSFTGEGDSQQSNSLSGRITVTVVEVLANGNLMVRGEKLITLNQGSEHVRLSGVVRPEDIRSDNSVQSTQVADARIIYGGQGTVAEANTKGWMQRFFDGPLWPF